MIHTTPPSLTDPEAAVEVDDASRLERLIGSFEREARRHSRQGRDQAAEICDRHSHQLRHALADSGSFSSQGKRPVDVEVKVRTCTSPPVSDAKH